MCGFLPGAEQPREERRSLAGLAVRMLVIRVRVRVDGSVRVDVLVVVGAGRVVVSFGVRVLVGCLVPLGMNMLVGVARPVGVRVLVNVLHVVVLVIPVGVLVHRSVGVDVRMRMRLVVCVFAQGISLTVVGGSARA